MTIALTVAAAVAVLGVIVSFTLRISRGIDRRTEGGAPEPTRGFYDVVVLVLAFFAAASIFKLTGTEPTEEEPIVRSSRAGRTVARLRPALLDRLTVFEDAAHDVDERFIGLDGALRHHG